MGDLSFDKLFLVDLKHYSKQKFFHGYTLKMHPFFISSSKLLNVERIFVRIARPMLFVLHYS